MRRVNPGGGRANTVPVGWCVPIYYRLESIMGKILEAYKDAWDKLKSELQSTKKTTWGKNEMQAFMDQILIECMESHLER